ncbi:dicarboxylate/amino acid:cation symporter [Paludifilum halophilum]|uniref:Dicarboxylate/amino acid:cation symporter n=1 Tax=Paludifilum halophilum TaxID=1642702 RepID=A0A235B2I0_9BACL|nr:dicarboxylate/amino acid:cation symporter [Paludifilum halophilum]OYD06484.1 dicarboxylate/amino acid:cation symporter [Paludifilum halophilum]
MKALWSFYRNQSFIIKISVGFLLGVVAGLLLGPSAEVLSPLGDLLLRLLNMIVLPIIFLTVILAVNQANPQKMGRIGGKVVLYYLVTTSAAILIGLSLALLVNPGLGLELPETEVEQPEAPSVIDTLLKIVPENGLAAFVNGDILSVLFLALVVGLTVTSMRHAGEERHRNGGESLRNLAQAGNEVAFRILDGILQYAPIGIFAISASTFGSQGLDSLASLVKLVGVVYASVGVQWILVYLLILSLFKIPVLPFFKNIREASTTAFFTSSSLGTLPVTLKSSKKAGIRDEVAHFSLPLGATANMDGAAIRLGASVVFAANIVGVDLSLSALLGVVLTGTLVSVGTAGVPAAGLVALSIVLNQAGLPIEIVGLVAGVDALLGMVATSCNVTGDLVGAAVVDQSERNRT